MSLRARLVLVAAAAVAAAVALASVVVYFIVRNDLRGQVDSRLAAQAERVGHAPLGEFAVASGQPNEYLIHPRGLEFAANEGYFQYVWSNGDIYRPDIYKRVSLPTTDRAREVASGNAD